MELKFETETCSRCGGSGKYSYCQTYGDKCFKCKGKGITLSKRGEAAKQYYIELCTVLASEVKIGDRILDGMSKGTVIDITSGIQEGASLKDGVMVPYKKETIVIELNNISTVKFIESKVFVYPTNNDNLIKAIEYQETLTKLGKPRKIKK